MIGAKRRLEVRLADVRQKGGTAKDRI